MLTRLLITPACLVLTVAGTSLAQRAAPEDVLRGPRVQQQAPGTEQPFGTSRRGGEGVQMQGLMRGIRSLNGDGAPDSVRLSAEQMEKMRDIFAGLRRSASPRAESPPEDRRGQPRGERRGADTRSATPRDTQPRRADSDMPEPRRGDARRGQQDSDRAREVSRAARQMWNMLTDEQRAYVRDGMEAAPMTDAPARRETTSRRGGPSWVQEMPPSLRERLDAMSAEEREVLWARLDRALADRGSRFGAQDEPSPRRERRGSDERRDRRPADR